MFISNTQNIVGKKLVRHVGLVSGNMVQSKHIGRDLAASFKNIIGGELKGYTELLNEARDVAIDRMKDEAQRLGANAVVNVRFTTSAITEGASELCAYGTAVIIEDE